jgi:ketosteroid isomerase-like protein
MRKSIWDRKDKITALTTPFGAHSMVAYFQLVDTRDIGAVLTWYADDATFTFANTTPTRGKPASALP